MRTAVIFGILLLCLGAIMLSAGCDKQKIVESTEYVHDIEYITLPPDTIFHIDTVFNNDSVLVHKTDTVRIHDTVRTTVIVHDTIRTTTTVTVHDTVTITQNQCLPNAQFAVAAMEVQTDPQVFDFISSEFGYTGGWVYYLSIDQMEITQVSSKVYDIYAYVDYWAEDFSGYYPLEIYWRMTYTSGDPANADNWTMGDPPTAVAGHRPGVNVATNASPAKLMSR
jgi:hypothetical protein